MMVKHKIRFPDGMIHLIEAPESATPEQVSKFAQETYVQLQAQQEQERKQDTYGDISGGEAALQSIVRNIPFGTDIQALGAGLVTGTPFSEAKDIMMEYTEQAKEQKPKSSMAGAVGGGVLSGIGLLPAKLMQGGTVATRALGAAAGGAGLGFGYGAQEGEDIGERLGSGLVQAGIEAPMGAIGSVASDALMAGGKAAFSKTRGAIDRYTKPEQAARNAYTGQTGQQSDDIISAMQEPLRSAPDINMQQGQAIPLTQGQVTQKPTQQALEAGALRGQYGDEARDIALRARDLQSDAAIEALNKTAGSPINTQSDLEASGKLVSMLKEGYRNAKNQTRQAYKGLAPERVGGTYVRDSVIPAVKDFKTVGTGGLGGFDLNAPNMGQANYFYNQLLKYGDKSIKDINLGSLETWRGGVKAATRKSDILPQEKMFLESMVDIYDTAMEQLPREALKSGDDEIFNGLLKARALRAEQGAKFERNKLVSKVLEQDEITPEQFRNLMFGKGKTFKADAPLRLEAIMRAVPEKADEIREITKAGTYANVFKNSLLDEIKEGSTEKLISFNKLETNLKELIDNPSFFNKIHTNQAERDAVKGFYNDVLKIKSMKPGTVNYSNTAYSIMDWLDKVSPVAMRTNIPFMPSAKDMVEGFAKTGATQDLKKQLGQVLQENLDQMESQTFNFLDKYGRKAIVSAIPSYTQRDNSLQITVRPSDAKGTK